MYRKSRKLISKLIILIMLVTTMFGDLSNINALAGDTTNTRKTDVWDFGGISATGSVYNNYISIDTLDNLTTVTDGWFTANTTFGDLTVVTPGKYNRLLYLGQDGIKGKKSYGNPTLKTFSDGYSSTGSIYCAGDGNDTAKYIKIENVIAGDNITIYSFVTNGSGPTTANLVLTSPDGKTVKSTYPVPSTGLKMDFLAPFSGTFKLYYTGSGSYKPNIARIVRTPGVKVSGTVKFNGADKTNASLTFINKETNNETEVSINPDNTFDTSVGAGYSYTIKLNGISGYAISNDTKTLNTTSSDIQAGINNINLNVISQKLVTVSGAVYGFDPGYNTNNFKITLTPPKESLAETVAAKVYATTMEYSADILPELPYNLAISGVNDYEIKSGDSVNITANAINNIIVAKKPVYTSTGMFAGLPSTVGVSSINFTNVDDGYVYPGTVAGGGYTVNLRDGAYAVQAVCTDTTYATVGHVVVNGSNVTKDIMFKSTAAPSALPWVGDLYVGDTTKENNFGTVKEALAAAARMNPTSEAQRITIHIAPGTYRAQLKVTTPYISLVNTDPSKEVKITWYYGVGYKYYSAGSDGLYNEERAFDKYLKGYPGNFKWGATVFLTNTATGFKAENIVFENSFNKYITDEELADGVELAHAEGSSITVERKYYTDATSRTSTERAAAMGIEADNTEFYKCSFLSSQDTLYTGNAITNQYYKNCYVEGNTDYIFGDGNLVFDNCTLNFYGYSDQAMGGYLTAAKPSASSNSQFFGYLFRDCIITSNSKNGVAPSFFGRPWGQDAKVTFLNTKLEDSSRITPQGWTDMGTAKAANAGFYEYNTTYNGVSVDTSSRVGKVLTDSEASAIKVTDYLGDWTPSHFVAESDAVPTFKVNPFFTTDDDINIPLTGNTISLNYDFTNSNDQLNDSSLIQWYRVSPEGNEQLIRSTAAYVSKTYKISIDDVGYYIKAIVTPETVNGKKGTPAEVKLDNLVKEGSSGGSGDIPDGKLVNIYVAGDSTVKTYTPTTDTAGWGEYLQKFFNPDKIKVVNYANGGRSSRSFINEGSLAKIASTIKSGDYLLVQFSHNDCANQPEYLIERFASVGTPDENGIYPVTAGKKEATPADLSSKYGTEYYPYSTGTFKWYLQQYIDVARNAGATPILVTPVSRQYFNKDGTIRPHHDAVDTTTGTITSTNNAYVKAIEQLAQEQNVKVIDMYNQTKDSFETAYKNDQAAKDGSSPLAKQIMLPSDATHNNKIGGIYDGALIAKGIQNMGYNISNYVTLPTKVAGLDSKNNLTFEVDPNSKVSVYTQEANGAYTTQLNEYWTGKTQALINSLSVSSSLTAPSSVTASAGSTTALIKWNAVSGATGYTIKAGTSSKSYTMEYKVNDANATSYQCSGLTYGATYYFVVTASNSNGESSPSDEVNETTGENSKLTPEDFTGYDVGSPAIVGTSSFNDETNTFTLTGAGTGISKNAAGPDQFYMSAVKLKGDFTISAKVNFANPATKAQIGVTIRDGLNVDSYHYTQLAQYGSTKASRKMFRYDGSVNGSNNPLAVTGTAYIKMTKIGDDITSIISISPIPEKPEPIDGVLVKNTATAAGLGLDANGNPKELYAGLEVTSQTAGSAVTVTFEDVEIVMADGRVVFDSNEGKPVAPKNVVVKPNDKSVSISWDALKTATSYTIKQGNSAEGPFTAVQTVTGSVYQALISGLENERTYYFAVTASNESGEGPASKIISAIPSATAAIPPVINMLSAEPAAEVFTALLPLSGSVNKASTLTIKHNGSLEKLTGDSESLILKKDGTFSYNLILAQGDNDIEIKALDEYGLVTTKQFKVTYTYKTVNINFCDINGNVVTSLNGKKDIIVKADVENYIDSLKDTTLIVGLYDEQNNLIKFICTSEAIPYGESEVFYAKISLPDDVSGYTLKAYIWDGFANIHPVSDIIVLK